LFWSTATLAERDNLSSLQDQKYHCQGNHPHSCERGKLGRFQIEAVRLNGPEMILLETSVDTGQRFAALGVPDG